MIYYKKGIKKIKLVKADKITIERAEAIAQNLQNNFNKFNIVYGEIKK